MSASGKRRKPRHTGQLPGDLSQEDAVARMIRVDQAGEHGAVRIYAGQLAVLGARPSAGLIRDMAEQEKEHLATFDALMTRRRVRPTLLSPLWSVAGFALGIGTALLGEKAAMACTAAIEETIDEHYADQAAALGNDDSELTAAIEGARSDERAHHDTAIAHGAREAPGYPVLSSLIKTGSRLAIWLSERA
jgi:ubiquinone biosynthesis monooxygenase Coq7